MVTDPVCKMSLEPAKAAVRVVYAGQTYYFCSKDCHRAFTANSQKYVGASPQSGHEQRP